MKSKKVFLIFALLTLVIIFLQACFFGYNEDFYRNFLVEAHGFLLDLIFVGIIFHFFESRSEKRREQETFKNKVKYIVDQIRLSSDSQAMRELVDIVREGNEVNVTSFLLYKCYLVDANLVDSDLSGSVLTDANLSNANLSGVIMRHSIAKRANLKGIRGNNGNFQDVNFYEADLTGASLIDADMRNVDFTNVKLNEVNLTRADLRGAKGVTFKGLRVVKSLHGARLDDTPETEHLYDEMPKLFDGSEEWGG